MEMRKCACGHEDVRVEEFSTDCEELPPLLWHAYCQECHIATIECFFKRLDAIQAWNEGKVE